jgi:hypothetical protein
MLLLLCDGVMRVHLHVREIKSEFIEQVVFCNPGPQIWNAP